MKKNVLFLAVTMLLSIVGIQAQNPTGVSLSMQALTLTQGTYATLQAIITPSDASGYRITWTSSDESVARITASKDKEAIIYADNPGTANITVWVWTMQDSTMVEYSANCAVTVTAEGSGNGFSVSGSVRTSDGMPLSNVTIDYGVAAVTTDTSGYYSISINSPQISLIPNKSGYTFSPSIINLTMDRDYIRQDFTAIPIGGGGDTTLINPTGISLSMTELTLTQGTYATLQAIITPSDASGYRITWTSSDESVARITASKDKEAIIYADNPGTANITAWVWTMQDSTMVEYSANCAVTVTAEGSGNGFSVSGSVRTSDGMPLSNVTIDYGVAAVTTDTSGYYSISINSPQISLIPNKSGYTFSPSIINLTMDRDYIRQDFTAIPIGGGGDTTLINPTGVSLSMQALTLTQGTYATLQAIITPSDASGYRITWTSSDESVARITASKDKEAIIYADNPGTANITAWVWTMQDSTMVEYSANCAVTVTAGGSGNGFSVSGSVRTSDGMPLSNVTIDYGVAAVTTDTSGYYSISINSPQISLIPNKSGYTFSPSIINLTMDRDYIRQDFTAIPIGGGGDTTLINPTGVSLSMQALTLTQGTYATLQAIITPSDASGYRITWTSSDESVARITASKDKEAIIYADNPGTANITAWVWTMQDSTMVEYSANCAVTVTAGGSAAISVQEIQINGKSAPTCFACPEEIECTLEVGKTLNLTATVLPANADNRNFSWTFEGHEYAKFSIDNSYRAVVSATATKASGGATFVVVSAVSAELNANKEALVVRNCTIRIVERQEVPVESVQLSRKEITVTESKKEYITFSVSPASAEYSYQWSSSNEEAAFISGSEAGRQSSILALNAGRSNIVIAITDINTSKIFKDTCAVTVVPRETIIPVQSVTISPETLTLKEKQTARLTAAVLPASASNYSITWASSNSDVAEVNENGYLRAKIAGTATVTATVKHQEKQYQASCEITVEAPLTGYKVTISKANLSLKPDAEAWLRVSVSPDVYYETYWLSTNPAIAEVLADGRVIGHESGTASVIANVVLPSTGAVFAVSSTVFVEAREIIIEETAPVGDNGEGTTELTIEIPQNATFEGSFKVEVPEGVTIDLVKSILAGSLGENMELTIDKVPETNIWVFTISVKSSAKNNAGLKRSLRSVSDFQMTKIVDIVYNVDESLENGDYEISISDLSLVFDDETVIARDETIVPLTVGQYENAGNETGISTPTEVDKKHISIYPNPAKDIIYISGISENAEILILDIAGKQIINCKTEGNSINVSALSRGVYLLKTENTTSKFVKQ